MASTFSTILNVPLCKNTIYSSLSYTYTNVIIEVAKPIKIALIES